MKPLSQPKIQIGSCFFPYKITPHAYSLLGLSTVLSGFALLALGIVLGIHYALDRSLYMNQLKETYLGKKSKEWNRHFVNRELKNLSIKQPEIKEANDLEECTRFLMEKQGLNEIDAQSYCEMLGNRWRGLTKSSEET